MRTMKEEERKRGRKKKGDKLMSCPMLGRCGKYGMCCDGRNFDECDFYKRLLKEPRKRRGERFVLVRV